MDVYRNTLDELVYFLQETEKKYTLEVKQLEQQAAGSLICSKRNGKYVFFRAQHKEMAYVRRGITNNKAAKAALCRKEYLERALSRIRRDIALLQKAAASYESFDLETLRQTMSKAYQMQPVEYFQAQEETDAWLAQWLTKYEQSTYRPEDRTNVTSRGLRVRSKGELAIAEMLYRYDVPFRYEREILLGNYRLVPDFEVLRRRDRKTWFWEHCGLPFDEEYMARHRRKLSIYESAGFVPWDNLIVTYNDRRGNLNMAIIESEIRNKLL